VLHICGPCSGTDPEMKKEDQSREKVEGADLLAVARWLRRRRVLMLSLSRRFRQPGNAAMENA
jgi:hypothetical protein